MTTATLTKSDMTSIVVNMSNVELHDLLANHSVNRSLGDDAANIIRAEAQRRGLI